MLGFLKRLALWTVICVVSAAPSFVAGLMLSDEAYHVAGMLTGVAIFIVAYTVVTGTAWFRRIRRGRIMRPTLYTGYGLRLLLTIVYPVGFVADAWLGIVSVSFVGLLLPDIEGYLAVVFTTLVQGTVLNGALAIVMTMIYGVLRLIIGRAPGAGVCTRCGYDLRASAQVCPECGLFHTSTLAPATSTDDMPEAA